MKKNINFQCDEKVLNDANDAINALNEIMKEKHLRPFTKGYYFEEALRILNQNPINHFRNKLHFE